MMLLCACSKPHENSKHVLVCTNVHSHTHTHLLTAKSAWRLPGRAIKHPPHHRHKTAEEQQGQQQRKGVKSKQQHKAISKEQEAKSRTCVYGQRIPRQRMPRVTRCGDASTRC